MGKGWKNRIAASQPRRREFLLRGECLEARQLLSVSPALHALASHAKPLAAPAIVTTLQSLPKTASYGQPVALVAKVTGATGGAVEFFDGTTELGSVNLSTRHTATYVVDTLGLGSHSLTAEYFLSSNTALTTADSTSAIVTETVKAAATHTVVVASSDPGVAGAGVSFTAIVGSWNSAFPNKSISQPAGTVGFTVTSTAAGATPITGSVTLDSAGAATYTPTTPLDAGTYSVVATFTPSDSNYAANTSKALKEKVVAASAVGAGTVTIGTSTTPATLRNGAQLYVNVTQGLDATTGALSESSGSIVTYVDGSHGINLTSTTITSVVFGPGGKLAEISGIGTNGTTDTPVNFTLFVNAGRDQWFMRPGVAISVYGAGINYHEAQRVTAGGISVNETTKSTVAIPMMQVALNDYALLSVLHDGRDFGFFNW